MPQITRYIPSHFEGREKETREFSSLEELLNIEWVDSFRELNKGEIDPDFYRYSISRYPKDIYPLMAEYKNGHSWRVIGFLSEDIKELPDWRDRIKATT